MRVLFALAGLHRYDRGAEVALMSVAEELVKGGDDVTLIGSGMPRPATSYRFIRAPSIRRERFEGFPAVPPLRSETIYEEASFAPALLSRFDPRAYDITATCSFPFVNWALRRPTRHGRPPHVFITQNGDWPAWSDNAEYRSFGCEGLVCTNPDFFERNAARWPVALIPNGVDVDRFRHAAAPPDRYGFAKDITLVLMVSALIDTKRVAEGVEAVSKIENAALLVAGDGPLRAEVDAMAERLLPGRYKRVSVPAAEMPSLYRSADIFLHMSREESFGNVFLEAMASGLPIVAHDTARVRWIVGDHQPLADTDDLEQLCEAINRARLFGPIEREENRARAQRFAWANIARQYRDFFSQIIETGAGARSPDSAS